MLRTTLTIAVALGVMPFPSGQQISTPRSLPHLRLSFPPQIPAESILVEYFLSGPFGGYGQIIPLKKDQRILDIPAWVDTQLAVNVKVIAYLPGCEYVRLDLPIDDAITTKDLRYNPVGTRRLRGKILGFESRVEGPVEIDVTYDPLWSHCFFGIADGMIATVPIASVTAAHREFTVDLPDFLSEGDGFFEFILTATSTGRASRLTRVQNGKPTYPLKAQASYEFPVEFALEPPHAMP